MKTIVYESHFNDEQLNKINTISRELDLLPETVKILYGRGVNSIEKIEKYLNAGKKNFLSPFLLGGMNQAVDIIKKAKKERKKVIIFGDYDADGVCASTILYLALKMYGICPEVYIPERVEGYSLSASAIDKIFDEHNPDLFITVDCGISAKKEVEYIKSKGAEVVVTDHHELPEILPDCVIVNPKIKSDYPYDNLCGAGVAYKLSQALIGEKAFQLIDFASLATIADSVPLIDENRDIVCEGVRQIKYRTRACFAGLLGENADITAQSLAFSIVPKINAAGRMGDVYSAFKLFISEDKEEIFGLTTKLFSYNLERQACCDELYNSAKEKLKEKGAYGKVIMLCDENWNSGFVGIVAARLAEEYKRPTLLFVKNNNMLKGSARSIESVNIFDALKACSEYIKEFGGHSQAAGINILPENFDALEKALCDYLDERYTDEDYVSCVTVTEKIDKPFTMRFAKELSKLEPFGVNNRKPLFVMDCQKLKAQPIKNGSPHINVKNDVIELMYFNGERRLKLMQSEIDKHVVFECNLSTYRGKEYLKGFIKDIIFDIVPEKFERSLIYNNFTNVLDGEKFSLNFLSQQEIKQIINDSLANGAYGTCLIASDFSVLKEYENLLKNVPINVFEFENRNLANVILVSPSKDCDFSAYREVIFLDKPLIICKSWLTGKNTYVCDKIIGYKIVGDLITDRNYLLKIYSTLKNNQYHIFAENEIEIAKYAEEFNYSKAQFIFSVMVFSELKLIFFSDGKIVFNKGVKAELTDSILFNKVNEIKENL